MKTYLYEEWRQTGEKLFGSDMKKWLFKCPNCSHVQSFEKLLAKYPEKEEYIRGSFYMSCEGRLNPKAGCDWTLGGLFQIHTVEIVKEGKRIPVFEFVDLLNP